MEHLNAVQTTTLAERGHREEGRSVQWTVVITHTADTSYPASDVFDRAVEAIQNRRPCWVAVLPKQGHRKRVGERRARHLKQVRRVHHTHQTGLCFNAHLDLHFHRVVGQPPRQDAGGTTDNREQVEVRMRAFLLQVPRTPALPSMATSRRHMHACHSKNRFKGTARVAARVGSGPQLFNHVHSPTSAPHHHWCFTPDVGGQQPIGEVPARATVGLLSGGQQYRQINTVDGLAMVQCPKRSGVLGVFLVALCSPRCPPPPPPPRRSGAVHSFRRDPQFTIDAFGMGFARQKMPGKPRSFAFAGHVQDVFTKDVGFRQTRLQLSDVQGIDQYFHRGRQAVMDGVHQWAIHGGVHVPFAQDFLEKFGVRFALFVGTGAVREALELSGNEVVQHGLLTVVVGVDRGRGRGKELQQGGKIGTSGRTKEGDLWWWWW